MISSAKTDEIKARLDIVDVVSDFVTLKKSGGTYKALSPFTNEKTPSFFVIPEKGIFKCFSSGKGGDAITFVMEHENISYPEALRYLAKKYGIALEESFSSAPDSTLSDSLFILNNWARDYFKGNLENTEQGISIANSYLTERLVSNKSVKTFELGYAMDSWDSLCRHSKEGGFNAEILLKSGLAAINEKGKIYDRFRGRIIFPIHNLAGKVAGFGGRIMENNSSLPKYINSSESEVYKKGEILYGLYHTKHSIRRNNFTYLVEGYIDLISLFQSGVENVVSSGGTSLTESQVRLIARFTNNVVVLFDGDTAGEKAAVRSINLILESGLNVWVVPLPQGEDPDSFSRKLSSTALRDYLSVNRQDFVIFQVDRSLPAIKDPNRRVELIRDILQTISLVQDNVKRSVYIQECSVKLRIPEQNLYSELHKIFSTRKRKEEQVMKRTFIIEGPVVSDILPTESLESNALIQIQELETIRLLMNYAGNYTESGNLGEFLMLELDDVEFTNPLYQKIIEQIRARVRDGIVTNLDYFLGHEDADIRSLAIDLLTVRREVSNNWKARFDIHVPSDDDRIQGQAYSNVLRLKLRIVQKMVQDNLSNMTRLESEGDESRLEVCIRNHMHLKDAEKEIAAALGVVITG